MTYYNPDVMAPTTIPIGGVIPYADNTPPAGFLECDGSAISRTTYANLFAAIGVTWGAGDGVTTFNIPDSRGEFLRGWDNGRGVDAGRAFATVQQATSIGDFDDTYRFMQNSDGNDGVSGADWFVMTAGPNIVHTYKLFRSRNIDPMYIIKY